MTKKKHEKNITDQPSFLSKLILTSEKIFQHMIQKIFELASKKRRIFEIAQLTLIYFLGIFQLLLASLQSIGYAPEIYRFFPFLKNLAHSTFGSFFSNPETTYILYLVAQEMIILRSHVFKLSLIVRYNILYIMTLEFLFYCIMNWVDILFNFEKDMIFQPSTPSAAVGDFSFTLFAIYLFVYIYSYIRAINRKLPHFPNPILQKIPDSIAFLLQIKREKPKPSKNNSIQDF